MKARIALMTLVAGMMAVSLVNATENTRWLNVHVTEPETETNVELHLPMNLVVSVLRGIDVDNFHAGKVDLELDDTDIDWEQIFKAVKEAPDGDFVRAKTEDADVEVSKKLGMVSIHVKEKGGDDTEADITMPMAMIDVLTIDDDNQMDVAAVLEGLAELPDGDLVRVVSREANVRIWIESP